MNLGESILREVDEQAEKAGMTRSEWLGVAVKRALDAQLTVAAMDSILAKVQKATGKPMRLPTKRAFKVAAKKSSRRATR